MLSLLEYLDNEVTASARLWHGSRMWLLLPERFRATHAEHIRKFATSRTAARLMGQRQEVFGLHKDGHEFPAEAAISYDKLRQTSQRSWAGDSWRTS